jgi:hypothetical protein
MEEGSLPSKVAVGKEGGKGRRLENKNDEGA